MALTNSLAGRNLGMILLAIWLILTGLLPLLNVRISSTVSMGLAILAIAAGILILLRK
ncbi:MAG TPA: hypothetical protein VNO50_05470 [Pyrinomonadaceae bacterium]|nr:hypothetical protein [Pyrinomonadaceae bacterium]